MQIIIINLDFEYNKNHYYTYCVLDIVSAVCKK